MDKYSHVTAAIGPILLIASLVIGMTANRVRDAAIRTLAVAVVAACGKAIFDSGPPAWWDVLHKTAYWAGYSIPTFGIALAGVFVGFWLLSAKTKHRENDGALVPPKKSGE